MGHKLQSGGN